MVGCISRWPIARWASERFMNNGILGTRAGSGGYFPDRREPVPGGCGKNTCFSRSGKYPPDPAFFALSCNHEYSSRASMPACFWDFGQASRRECRNILNGAPASPATIGCMSGESQTEAIVSPDGSARPPAGAPVNPSAPPKSRVEGEVVRLRGLLEKGQFAAALADAQSAARARCRKTATCWYIVAVSQRYLQRIPDALSTLAQLERLHPDYSRLYQERGHCHVACAKPLRRSRPSCGGERSTPRFRPAGRR